MAPMATRPAARPSRPSTRLMALTVTITSSTVMGTPSSGARLMTPSFRGPNAGSQKNSTCTPPRVMVVAARIWPASLTGADRPLRSSTMPMPTISEAPMAMPAASEETNSRGNSSDDTASPPTNPKNRGSPPGGGGGHFAAPGPVDGPDPQRQRPHHRGQAVGEPRRHDGDEEIGPQVAHELSNLSRGTRRADRHGLDEGGDHGGDQAVQTLGAGRVGLGGMAEGVVDVVAVQLARMLGGQGDQPRRRGGQPLPPAGHPREGGQQEGRARRGE